MAQRITTSNLQPEDAHYLSPDNKLSSVSLTCGDVLGDTDYSELNVLDENVYISVINTVCKLHHREELDTTDWDIYRYNNRKAQLTFQKKG